MNPVKQYTKFKIRDMFYCTLLFVGVVRNVRSKKLEKKGFWNVLVYISILFVLKMFISSVEIMIVQPGG